MPLPARLQIEDEAVDITAGFNLEADSFYGLQVPTNAWNADVCLWEEDAAGNRVSEWVIENGEEFRFLQQPDVTAYATIKQPGFVAFLYAADQE